MSIWQKCLQDEVPHVILDKILYYTNQGQVLRTWLDKHGQIHANVPTKHVGVVPKKWRKQLTNTGYRLNKLGAIPIT